MGRMTKIHAPVREHLLVMTANRSKNTHRAGGGGGVNAQIGGAAKAMVWAGQERRGNIRRGVPVPTDVAARRPSDETWRSRVQLRFPMDHSNLRRYRLPK